MMTQMKYGKSQADRDGFVVQQVGVFTTGWQVYGSGVGMHMVYTISDGDGEDVATRIAHFDSIDELRAAFEEFRTL